MSEQRKPPLQQSPAERLANIRDANEIRMGRARIYRLLKSGEARLDEVIAEPVLAGARIGDLLRRCRGLGDFRSEALLRAAGLGGVPVSSFRPVADLTARELERLLVAYDATRYTYPPDRMRRSPRDPSSL